MYKRIIPRIDIKNNNLVKGINLEGLRVLGDPRFFIEKYYLEGADEIYCKMLLQVYTTKVKLKNYRGHCKKHFYKYFSW